MVFAYGYNWNSIPHAPRHAPRPPDAGDYAIQAVFGVLLLGLFLWSAVPALRCLWAERNASRQGSSPP